MQSTISYFPTQLKFKLDWTIYFAKRGWNHMGTWYACALVAFKLIASRLSRPSTFNLRSSSSISLLSVTLGSFTWSTALSSIVLTCLQSFNPNSATLYFISIYCLSTGLRATRLTIHLIIMASVDHTGQRGQKRPRADTDTAGARTTGPNIRSVKPPSLRASESDHLFDIFTKRGSYWTIFDIATSFMPVGDIIALQRTCKATAPIYKELQQTQWNINVRLERFFRQPKAFRSALGENDALVSGSFALQFFGECLVHKSSSMKQFYQLRAVYE